MLTEQLLRQAHDGVDPGWLELVIRPAHLPVAPQDAWYGAWERALGPGGAVGDALRASDGVVAALDGPDYVRVLLAGDPTLSVVVRRSQDQAVPVIDSVQWTSCTLCTEPARFVRDLLADVHRRRSASERLLPNVELYVADHIDAEHLVPHHWLAALEARNHRSGHLAWLLVGAEVEAVDGDRVTVALADGRRDAWPIVYEGGTWQVHYAALSEDSPLRMSGAEAREWRSRETRVSGALHGWAPSWRTTSDGAGVQAGDRAIGAWWDPRDGTLLVGVLDLDRTLAGVFRLDLERQRVLARVQVPPPGDTTKISLGTWFARWHMAVSPDAREVAITTPSRLWRVDLATDDSTLAQRTSGVVALAYSGRATELLVGEGRGQVSGLSDLAWYADLGGAPVLLARDGEHLVGVTVEGAVRRVDPAHSTEVTAAWACDEGVSDAALHVGRAEVLVTCAAGSSHLAERVPVAGGAGTVIDGTPTDRRGASWSPDGALFTTPAAGDGDPVLLWDAIDNRPIATLGEGEARSVVWSPDSSQLATVGADGSVWVWDLALVRRHRGL